jgi:thiol-disulfide isomerase/thioredoxin
MSVRGSILAVAAICLALSACGKQEDASPAATPPVAQQAPAAPASAPASAGSAATAATPAEKPAIPSLVIDTFDGKKFDLAEHRGHWVIVNFWATWCNPCLKEMPDLDAFDQQRDDVDVIGLSYEEIEKADMTAFLKEHVVHYPIAVLDVYKPPADFDTPRGLPMTYVIAPDGKVAKKFLGPVTTADLAILIRDAAKLQPSPST